MSFIKALAFALITWWAVTVLTGRNDIAFLIAALPLVLGILGIMTGPVFTLAALLFMGAIFVRAAPMLDLHLPTEVTQVRQQLARLLAPENPPSPPAPGNP